MSTYKGLLHPLGLPSSTHIALVCDKKPIETRVEKTNIKVNTAITHLKRLEENYKHIESLYQLIVQHENFTGGPVPSDKFIQKLSKRKLIEAYKLALPKLVKLQKILGTDFGPNPENCNLDARLNKGIDKYEPKLTQISALVKAAHHFYEGKVATLNVKYRTAQEKLRLFNQVRQSARKCRSSL